MSEEDKHFIKRYGELLDKGYCDCNEMNCIDNNSLRRILKIVKELDNINEKLSLALESAEQRIDKATNYINENWGHWCSDHCKYATETINILKGNEENK